MWVRGSSWLSMTTVIDRMWLNSRALYPIMLKYEIQCLECCICQAWACPMRWDSWFRRITFEHSRTGIREFRLFWMKVQYVSMHWWQAKLKFCFDSLFFAVTCGLCAELIVLRKYDGPSRKSWLNAKQLSNQYWKIIFMIICDFWANFCDHSIDRKVSETQFWIIDSESYKLGRIRMHSWTPHHFNILPVNSSVLSNLLGLFKTILVPKSGPPFPPTGQQFCRLHHGYGIVPRWLWG